VRGKVVFGAGMAAIAAALLGLSGLAGTTGTHFLLAFAAAVALNLTRAPRRD
jgi:hypothetical protein